MSTLQFLWGILRVHSRISLGFWVLAAIMTGLMGPADVARAGRLCQRLHGSHWQNVIHLYLCPCDNCLRLWPQLSAVSCTRSLCRKVCCAQCRLLAAAAAAAGNKDSTVSWFTDATGKSQKEAATPVTERLLSGGTGNIDLLCDGRRSKGRGQSWPRLRQAAGPWPWVRH